ncbi:MAG: hypothetical protein CBB97_09440 [Candidatus Endolissoclinum sp. TMED37]|nr:MAG: hypothetical protein CBB97_09440 [Candidatus Endolissoclinum sp. TMED37]
MDFIRRRLRKFLEGDSLVLALIYTVGHIVIAMIVVTLMTGASLWEAGAVAIIEPSINGVWFYILHMIWKKRFMKKEESKDVFGAPGVDGFEE